MDIFIDRISQVLCSQSFVNLFDFIQINISAIEIDFQY